MSIACYKGVVTELINGVERITELVFNKYPMTLADLSDSSLAYDADSLLADIENGVDHMHSLGLVHIDIKSSNIFVTKDFQNPTAIILSNADSRAIRAVIGDFNSVHRKGEPLRLKWGLRRRVARREQAMRRGRHAT